LQKKAIIFIITKLELGGAQKVCLSLAKQVRSKHTDTIVITGPEGLLLNQAHRFASRVITLPYFQWNVSPLTLWKEFAAFFSMHRQLRLLRKEYDEIVVHTHSTKAGVMGRLASWCAGITRIIHTVHGFGFRPYKKVYAWWVHYLLEYMAACVTDTYVYVSQRDAEQGKMLLPAVRKTEVIRAAVDARFFIRPARRLQVAEKERLVLGTVSNLKPEKNVFALCKIVHWLIVCGHDVQLEIVGDGPQRAQIESFIAQHNLKERIILHGWRDEVSSFLCRWDVCVLASLWEGLACAVIEARLCHVPVVSYDVGGISEVIVHEKNGLLVPAGRSELLTKALVRIITDDQLRYSLRDAQDNLHDFDERVMSKRYESLYLQK